MAKSGEGKGSVSPRLSQRTEAGFADVNSEGFREQVVKSVTSVASGAQKNEGRAKLRSSAPSHGQSLRVNFLQDVFTA